MSENSPPGLPAARDGSPTARRLVGRVALVTGASRGIGLAIAHRLVAEGAKVAITARNADALDQAVAGLGSAWLVFNSWVFNKADDPDHQDEALASLAAMFGPVDVLVNNAGINPAFGKLVDLPLAAAKKILEVNVLGTLAWTQRVHAAGMAERGGSIVNALPRRGQAGVDACRRQQGGHRHPDLRLAVELGPKIRVNAVAPAVVKTKFAEALYLGREEQVAAQYPLGRLGLPDDVAGAVAFLASDEGASWITGPDLRAR